MQVWSKMDFGTGEIIFLDITQKEDMLQVEYSVALMYCGRLEEALEYAERGALEEPDYPWIWLQVGKLRAHFGDQAGALVAVEQGLKLEPGDYEFLTLQEEIKAGATLEQMEYHWINPDADQTLQRGLDENAKPTTTWQSICAGA